MTKTNPANTTWHVTFTRAEDQLLREQAAAAGLSVTAYIRQQALHGHVIQRIDWEALRAHSDILCDAVMQLSLYLHNIRGVEQIALDDVLRRLQGEVESLLDIEGDLYHFVLPAPGN